MASPLQTPQHGTSTTPSSADDDSETIGPVHRVLIDYLHHLSQLPTPPYTPIFLPAETTLLLHKRIIVAPHAYDPTFSESYYCTLTTKKVGRTWLLEARAEQLPCWVYAAGVPVGGGDERIKEPVERRMVMEKRDAREGPDPGWGDLRRVIWREALMRESAYFVDSVTGAVEGLDT